MPLVKLFRRVRDHDRTQEEAPANSVPAAAIYEGTPKAKAALWAPTDSGVRKHGERTGLDTLVVHAVNDECAAWLSSARVVRCLVKSYNERNHRFVLLRHAPKEKVFATDVSRGAE
ncbi:hypothetical protein VNO78_12239 [Psophocarpus tetragonolobus]|uniref:Uncharacterized protein n=1 Tax=Psophocarpus tetragonolobus TaxID=3891 RepID=A0AAN9XPD0_PSOTE